MTRASSSKTLLVLTQSFFQNYLQHTGSTHVEQAPIRYEPIATR
jgi:hypothetical protein